jgi:hypothetical protein
MEANMSSPVVYSISLPEPSKARGNDSDLSFRSQSASGFAEELQAALASPALFEKWRAKQPDPDAVEAQWGVTDPEATVTGEQHDLHIDLTVRTRIDSEVFKQRLRMLAGPHWQMRDVRS